MVKRITGKGVGFKKILAGAALVAFLSPSQVAHASNSTKNSNKKSPLSFIVGGRRGIERNKSSKIEFGLKYKSLALVGSIPISSYSNVNLQKTEENIMGDVDFRSREDLENFSSSIGASFEWHQPLARGISWVTGIGGHRESYTRKIEEKLLRGETELASNTSSVLEKEFVLNVYTGPSLKVAKGLELNVNLGYEIGSKKNGLKRGMGVSVRAIYLFPGKGGNR